MYSNMYYFIADSPKPAVVAEAMSLHKMADRRWFIQGTCASTGEGLYEGFNAMADLVKDFKKKGTSW